MSLEFKSGFGPPTYAWQRQYPFLSKLCRKDERLTDDEQSFWGVLFLDGKEIGRGVVRIDPKDEEGPTATLAGMEIVEAERGKGRGKFLFNALEDLAICVMPDLKWWRLVPNTPELSKWYQSMGYRPPAWAPAIDLDPGVLFKQLG